MKRLILLLATVFLLFNSSVFAQNTKTRKDSIFALFSGVKKGEIALTDSTKYYLTTNSTSCRIRSFKFSMTVNNQLVEVICMGSSLPNETKETIIRECKKNPNLKIYFDDIFAIDQNNKKIKLKSITLKIIQ